MRTIDNNGRGNCGYYAYSISLMYFLRTQSDETIATVLGRFPLSASDLDALKRVLRDNKGVAKAFSEDRLQLIQNTLGHACRTLASSSVKREFLESPTRTHLYSAAAYHFFLEFHRLLAKQYQAYVEVPSDELGDYSEAELYKTPGMKAAMTSYAQTCAGKIQSEFDSQWEKLKPSISANREKQEKISLMDRSIQSQTLKFFQQNDGHFLNVYVNHLNQDRVWASEETLLSLHRKVTHERSIYDKDFDTWLVNCETPITLNLFSNGVNRSGNALPEQPNIILNNIGNYHWVSIIPDAYCPVETFAESINTSIKQLGSSCCLFSEKQSAKPKSATSTTTPKTIEEKLDVALKCMTDKQEKEDYKPILLSLFAKENTIDDIETAEPFEGESDEAFAERLQIAELNAFLR